jgi:hypothetical protein
MSTHKNIDRICIVVLVLTLLVIVLFMNGESLGVEVIVDEDAESYTGTAYFTANDLNGEWDSSGATVITLNGAEAKVSGPGAYAYDGGVVISNAGYFVVSGTLTDGSITVDTYNSSKVWILLDGVDITCSDDACIRVDEADKVFLTLAAGSVNSLSSGAEYSEDALADGTDGAIFAHDDLTINGSGSLTVTAAYKHGIAANDDLVITGGDITVDSAADAIHVNDSFCFTGATLTIRAADDGIHSDTDVYVESGTIYIEECYEGIEAPEITIDGGDIAIYPSDDGLNANGGSSAMGFFGIPGGRNTTAAETANTEESSLPFIRISGGSLTIVNETGRDADGLDSNGDIYITGGTIRISLIGSGSNSALDYGSESGGVCEISGGTVIACGASSMAEGFSDSSGQCSVLYNFDGAEAGTTVTLTDASGNVLLNWAVPCSFSSVVLSCPEMALGETYQVQIGDGTEALTLESISTSLGSQGGMFGGMGGGMQPPGGMGGGFGGQGGRGGGPGNRGGQTGGTAGGEMPEMPQFDGEAPQFDGEMPQFDSQWPDRDNGAMPGGLPNFDSQTDNADQSGSVPDTNTWVLVGVTALALLAGLLFAIKFKEKL